MTYTKLTSLIAIVLLSTGCKSTEELLNSATQTVMNTARCIDINNMAFDCDEQSNAEGNSSDGEASDTDSPGTHASTGPGAENSGQHTSVQTNENPTHQEWSIQYLYTVQVPDGGQTLKFLAFNDKPILGPGSELARQSMVRNMLAKGVNTNIVNQYYEVSDVGSFMKYKAIRPHIDINDITVNIDLLIIGQNELHTLTEDEKDLRLAHLSTVNFLLGLAMAIGETDAVNTLLCADDMRCLRTLNRGAAMHLATNRFAIRRNFAGFIEELTTKLDGVVRDKFFDGEGFYWGKANVYDYSFAKQAVPVNFEQMNEWPFDGEQFHRKLTASYELNTNTYLWKVPIEQAEELSDLRQEHAQMMFYHASFIVEYDKVERSGITSTVMLPISLDAKSILLSYYVKSDGFGSVGSFYL